jgi:hypothetical protein
VTKEGDSTPASLHRKPNSTAHRLSGLCPVSLCLDAVRYSVADSVHESVSQRHEHVRIELHVATLCFEVDLLPDPMGGIAHGSIEDGKHGVGRDEA